MFVGIESGQSFGEGQVFTIDWIDVTSGAPAKAPLVHFLGGGV
jgi:hypothetical protein